MAIVFIEEVGAPIRVCSKQVTAERLGIAWADVDLTNLEHLTEHYTLSGGSLVELTAVIDAAVVEAEKRWVEEQLVEADNAIRKHNDLHSRTVATKAEWRTYRNALRDHVISDVVQGTRPTQPGGV
jgi:hypothetical protein